MSNKPQQARVSPNFKIQPPLLALIHVVLAFLLAWLIPLPWTVPPSIQVFGFLLVILGFLLGVAALIAFRQARSTRIPKGSSNSLVTSGIYRFTRNPVYLGFLFILVGISLDLGSYWGLILAPVMIILFNRLVIEPEEVYLTQKFGNAYTSYRAKVRRWL